MSLQWKKHKDSMSDEDLFSNTSTRLNLKKEFTVNTSEPVMKYVEKYEKWCERYNPESYGLIKNLSKIHNLKCYESVVETIKDFENIQITSLHVKDIQLVLDPNGISDGDRIRKILHHLTCMGFLNKEIQTHTKDGKELKRIRYKFSICDQKVVCPYYKSQLMKNGKTKHSCFFDWKDAEMTQFYQDDGEE